MKTVLLTDGSYAFPFTIKNYVNRCQVISILSIFCIKEELYIFDKSKTEVSKILKDSISSYGRNGEENIIHECMISDSHEAKQLEIVEPLIEEWLDNNYPALT